MIESYFFFCVITEQNKVNKLNKNCCSCFFW